MESQAQSAHYADRISTQEYDRQAAEYTAQMVEQLNQDVRAQPSIGSKSTFFQDPENRKKGLPVFQGKHTRFVYDQEEEEIVAAVDASNAPLPAPHLRTTDEIESSDEEEEEWEEGEEEDYEDEQENTEMGDSEMQTDQDAPMLDVEMLDAMAQELADMALLAHST